MMSGSKQNQIIQARDLKHRVLTCLHKLSDRDTYAAAAAELESIAVSLSPDTLPPFLTSIAATDASDKSPVRKQCLKLISIVSEHHGNTLSPHLSKLLSAVVRRLRDPDSAVRAACVSAAGAISCSLSNAHFNSIAKPFTEALFTEQDLNAQMGSALCLSAVIEGSENVDIGCLRKLVSRLEKLVKCESFKAKAALLTLIGSVIGVGGAGSKQILRGLVPCLADVVSKSEDWAARKAAAEALMRLAVVEREGLSEYKESYLKTFESKRFDKVKAVRETMNQMVEAWKEIPDSTDEVSGPAESQSSNKAAEDASDGRYPPGSRTSLTVSSGAPQLRKKTVMSSKSCLPHSSSAITARKRSPLDSSEKKTGPAMFRKLDRKKPSSWQGQTTNDNSGIVDPQDVVKGIDERMLDKSQQERDRLTKPEVKRSLFNKAGSRVVPCHEEGSESTIIVDDQCGNLCRTSKDSEDLSLIRNQLVQIEKQQSNLFDLLQRFIGSSEKGMHSLETRVHGLELALDEISFDLALSSGRMSNTDSAGAMCCKLPGADLLTSMLWKRSENRCLTSRYSASNRSPQLAAVRSRAEINEHGGALNRDRRLQGGRGFIVNPLAEIHNESRGISEVSLTRGSNSAHPAV